MLVSFFNRLLAQIKAFLSYLLPLIYNLIRSAFLRMKPVLLRMKPIFLRLKTKVQKHPLTKKAIAYLRKQLIKLELPMRFERMKKSLFGRYAPAYGEDGVEFVDAEAVDPNKPIETGEAEEDQEPKTPVEKVLLWLRRQKTKVYYFFIPMPVMVSPQLTTPEIDLDEESSPEPLRGRTVYIVIIVFFLIMVLWASISEIDEVVRAEGEIVPSDSVQLVQSRLPGSVVAIHVNLGDKVQKGDVLFEVEDEDVRANFDDNEIHRLTSLASIQRLQAESTGATEISFPALLEEEAPQIVAQERAVFISRRKALRNDAEIIEQEIESLRLGIAERKAETRQAKLQMETINEELAVIKPLVDKGYEPKLSLISIQSRLNEATGREELSRLAADRMESDLVAQTRRLESLESRFRAEAEAQLVEVGTRAAQTLARLDALTEKVAFTEIKAPVEGIITAVHVNTVGGVVDGGQVLADIIPLDDEVTVRARVATDDVSKIVPGQEVYVSLTSYDMSRYGRLDGVVDRIAANSTQEQNVPPYFVAIVKVPNPVFPETGITPEIVPGTPVIVDMVAGKRTIMTYILSPINRAQTIVFREK